MQTALDVLVAKLGELAQSSEQFLVGGGAKDFAEYREVCGRVRGLRLAIDEAKALAQNLEETDD